VKITHSVQFDFDLILKQQDAIDFVRNAQVSLSKASFIQDLQTSRASDPQVGLELEPEETPGDRAEASLVSARIPVNAALFGQQELVFQSLLVPTPCGASLESLPLHDHKPGWAEVAGEAEVRPHPKGSQVTYRFDITIHLHLPEPEKWGGRALLKMIEYTAQRVLQNITSQFPGAVQAAAREVEAAYHQA
jgi:hypothetical protein